MQVGGEVMLMMLLMVGLRGDSGALRLASVPLLGSSLGLALDVAPLQDAGLQALLLAGPGERLVVAGHTLALPLPVALQPPPGTQTQTRLSHNTNITGICLPLTSVYLSTYVFVYCVCLSIFMH